MVDTAMFLEQVYQNNIQFQHNLVRNPTITVHTRNPSPLETGAQSIFIILQGKIHQGYFFFTQEN